MRNKILLIALVGSFAVPAWSNEPSIYFGNSPMYGKQLRVLDGDRLTYRLSALEESGGGEDEEFILACYSGAPKSVCGLISRAVRQENELERLFGPQKLELKICELAGPRSPSEKNLRVVIESQNKFFRFPSLPACPVK